MKKIILVVITLALYALAFAPFLLRSHFPPELTSNIKINLILDYILGGTVICLFFSLLALVLRLYKTSLIIGLIPIFVESVFACSTLLIFIFHKEISHAFIVGKVRTVGTNILSVIKAPFKILHK